MKNFHWKDAAELMGIAAIVASLVFVGLELQQGQRIAQADRQFQQIERELQLTNLIADHSELIVKMNSSQQLTERELVVADRLVQSIWQAHFFSASQRQLLDAAGGHAAIRSLATYFADNPGLKRHYREQIVRHERDTELTRGSGFVGFGKEFHEVLAEYLEVLESSGR